MDGKPGEKGAKSFMYIFTTKKFIAALLILSLALNVSLILRDSVQKEEAQRFRLIDPLLINPSDTNETSDVILHYNDLKEKIQSDIENITSLNNVGVFVQDIHIGSWMGINERETFFPASLLKIPVMMVILKKVDRGEMKLNDTITLDQVDLEAGSGDLYARGAGANFTVYELLKEMVLSSDNTAKNALKRYISQAELNSVFAHVGVPNPYLNSSAGVSPRGYNRFFKSLYYSTFISPELSEKALDLTFDTQREDLLPAGTPIEIRVAHKYGETIYGTHDCGIVYHPKKPYFICIMTENMELANERGLIVKISEDVFNFVNNM